MQVPPPALVLLPGAAQGAAPHGQAVVAHFVAGRARKVQAGSGALQAGQGHGGEALATAVGIGDIEFGVALGGGVKGQAPQVPHHLQVPLRPEPGQVGTGRAQFTHRGLDEGPVVAVAAQEAAGGGSRPGLRGVQGADRGHRGGRIGGQVPGMPPAAAIVACTAST
ncbi:hypothetical protein GCM10020000_85060 [Streptomyces olivoverticillatus]